VEEAASRWHYEQAAHLGATPRLAEDRDVCRVTAEGPDVVAHPLQDGHQVEVSVVTRGRELLAPQLTQVQISEGAESMVHCHHHDIAASGERRTVVQRPRTGPD
jgi:hypothetical protein